MYATVQTIGHLIQQFFAEIKPEGFDIEKIKKLLASGQVSINSKAPNGEKQALHIACERKIEKKDVESLIQLGADVNAKTLRGFTPLHVAAQQGLTDIMITLIKTGAKVDAITDGEKGTTPLQEAASKGHTEAVRVLMAAGANSAYREGKYSLNAIELAKKSTFPEIAKSIEYAILGAEEAFKEQVSTEISKWQNTCHIKNPAEQQYIRNLSNISDALSADDCFKELQATLAQGYEPIKENMRPLRSKLVGYMNEYNKNKQIEHKLKAIFSDNNVCEISPCLSF